MGQPWNRTGLLILCLVGDVEERNGYVLESFLLSRNSLQVKHPERVCRASNLREKKASLSGEE